MAWPKQQDTANIIQQLGVRMASNVTCFEMLLPQNAHKVAIQHAVKVQPWTRMAIHLENVLTANQVGPCADQVDGGIMFAYRVPPCGVPRLRCNAPWHRLHLKAP